MQESSFEFSLHIHPVFSLSSLAIFLDDSGIAALAGTQGFIHPIKPNLSLKHPWAVVSQPLGWRCSVAGKLLKQNLCHNFDCVNHRKLFSVLVQNLPCWCKWNIPRLPVCGLTLAESCLAFTPWRWLASRSHCWCRATGSLTPTAPLAKTSNSCETYPDRRALHTPSWRDMSWPLPLSEALVRGCFSRLILRSSAASPCS